MPDKLSEWVDEIPYNCRHFGEDIRLFTRFSLANARKSEPEKRCIIVGYYAGVH